MAPASLANFNTRQGRGRQGWWERDRKRESEANKTHVRCRQAASLSSATCEIYFRAAPFSDALWQTPPHPTSCTRTRTRIRISTANPDSPHLNQVREFWQNQKVASANRLEAFRALANENTFIFTSPPRLPLYTSNPFCHTSFRAYSWPAIGSTSILELRTKVAVPSQTHFSLAYLLLFWQPTKSEINVDKQFCDCITSAP